jgi:hypothetical protein
MALIFFDILGQGNYTQKNTIILENKIVFKIEVSKIRH